MRACTRAALLAPSGLLVAVLAAAQLVLPRLSARGLRARLERDGEVLEVSVRAFPAVVLLWHRADRVVVRLARYRTGAPELAAMLGESGETRSLDAWVGELDAKLLTLRGVRLSKRGDELTGSARVTQHDLRAALPVLESVEPVAAGDEHLRLRATVSVLGVGASVDLTLEAQNGALILAPDLPLGGLGRITVFSSRRLYVEEVGGSPLTDGFSAFVRARLL